MEYLKYRWNAEKSVTLEREQQIFYQLPKSLKDNVYSYLYHSIMKKFKIFSVNFSEGFLQKIVEILAPIQLTPEETIPIVYFL